MLIAIGIGVSSAHAAPIYQFMNFNGENTLTGDDREYLLDRVGEVTGQIDVGDSIRGHAIWDRINNNPVKLENGGAAHVELTSVFQLQVTGKTEVEPGEYVFTFGPDPTFAEAQALGLDGQAMMIFYHDEGNGPTDGAFDYTDPRSPHRANTEDDGTDGMASDPGDVSTGPYEHEEDFIATATNGEYYWALGYTGAVVDGVATAANGEGWETNEAIDDSVLPFFDTNRNVTLTTADFSLNRLTGSEAGLADDLALQQLTSVINSNYQVDFNGSQTWDGVENRKTAFEIATQTTLNFSVIPLPPAAAMGLLLLGGLGGLKMWRSREESVVA